ncbi:MAG: hypothetical protein RBU28_09625 [Bacteroidales bacterium]|nr:hypothetical protein [Bacteroidales bacterium]
MNKRLFTVSYFLLVILAFSFSLVLSGAKPMDCYGSGCFNMAKTHCDNECAKRSMVCFIPQRVYGACLGYYTSVCLSLWGIVCEDMVGYGTIECVAYDPWCYGQ